MRVLSCGRHLRKLASLCIRARATRDESLAHVVHARSAMRKVLGERRTTMKLLRWGSHSCALRRGHIVATWFGALLLGVAFDASSQTATIFQEDFTSGLGQFTSSGSVATSGNARMRGSAFSSDGSITS